MPHERLRLLKVHHYGFRGKLDAWLCCFLAGQKQRVVINGSSSCWSPVLSGVPQGTVLGPILFLLFINDIPGVISSHIKLFADDCVLFRNINSASDHQALQHDLIWLEKWANSWQMSFAPTKCMAMSITLRRVPSLWRYSPFIFYFYNDLHLHEVYFRPQIAGASRGGRRYLVQQSVVRLQINK